LFVFRFAIDVEMDVMNNNDAAEIASLPIGVDLMLEVREKNN
jgi:hypothetical protein